MNEVCGACGCTPDVCKLRGPLNSVNWPPYVCLDCLAEWYDPTKTTHDSWESVGEYVQRQREKSEGAK